MKERVRNLLIKTLEAGQRGGQFPPGPSPPFEVERPKVKQHGEFATNLAFLLAPRTGSQPIDVAKNLIGALVDPEGIVEKAELAGGGFVNFSLKKKAWQDSLREIASHGNQFGRFPELGRGKKVLVEFISANPTGPLHIGNARGGPIGDVLASLLEATGYQVVREYYVNDIGGQIDQLGEAVLREYKKLRGEKVEEVPTSYRGEYLREIAQSAASSKNGDKNPEDLGRYAVGCLTQEIERDCLDIGIHFNSWFQEGTLLAGKSTEKVIEELKRRGATKEREGALWFAPSDEFLQDRECVLIRSDGRPTYFANDIAYHVDKDERGFDLLLNIWGSNHHGHVPRIQAALKALGRNPEKLRVILYQFVRVKRGNEIVKMSKRAGNYVTAREVLEEVGRDALRFFLLMRGPESHLDFDLELAKKQSQENPVYYVQYAHARLASIFRKAMEKKVTFSEEARLKLLDLPEEIDLIRRLHQFPEEILLAAQRLEPQRIPFYLLELAKEFQAYYSRAREDPRYRILSADIDTSQAKMYLCRTLKDTFAAGLKLIGVSAPESMQGEEQGSGV